MGYSPWGRKELDMTEATQDTCMQGEIMSQDGALIQQEWRPYEKRRRGHRHTQTDGCVGTAGSSPHTSQGEGPQKKLTLRLTAFRIVREQTSGVEAPQSTLLC